MVTLLESYCLWIETFDNIAPRFGKSPLYQAPNDPLFMEKKFYFSVLQIVMGELNPLFVKWLPSNFLLYSGNGTLFTLLRMFTANRQNNPKFTLELFRGFMLASIAKFLFLPIVIWKEETDTNTIAVHLIIIVGYFVLSLIYIHSVVSSCAKKWSAITVLLAFILGKYLLWKISIQLKSHLY
jgi:hypothetical protein